MIYRSNPMQNYKYVPLGGFIECSESKMILLVISIAYWSRYVGHYINPSFSLEMKLKLVATYVQIESLLPDFDINASIDGM